MEWPVFHIDEVIDAINNAPSYVKRTCVSMITNGKCRLHTLEITKNLKEKTSLPISLLISPTILDKEDLVQMKEFGADKIGVAIDLATPALFDKFRGTGVSGPHRWKKYWEIMETALDIFGPLNVGAHLMVGMGETENEMVAIMNQLWGMGVANHLFSFFAEEGSRLSDRAQPPWPTYLRVQMARYLIEEGISSYENMAFDSKGHIIDFGITPSQLDDVIKLGIPFMTTGCLGPDGQVACNRPFGNCMPDVNQWNYPYLPNDEEISLISQNLFRIE